MAARFQTPDVKALVMAYVAAEQDLPVFSKRPDPDVEGPTPPAAFVRVLATGGPGRSQRILQTVQLTIDTYSTSTGAAYTAAAVVDALMQALPSSTVPVTAVTGSTPAEMPDPDIASPRYTATYQLTVRCL